LLLESVRAQQRPRLPVEKRTGPKDDGSVVGNGREALLASPGTLSLDHDVRLPLIPRDTPRRVALVVRHLGQPGTHP